MPILSVKEWKNIFEMSREQCLSPLFGKVLLNTQNARIAEDDTISAIELEDLLMKWAGDIQLAAKRNFQINKCVVEVANQFNRRGYATCLLKGQGVGLLHLDPLTRIPGDVDLWLQPKVVQGNKQYFSSSRILRNENICTIIRMIRKMAPDARAIYHHIECPSYNGIEIEVHYRPSYMQSPIHNHRLQLYFAKESQEQFSNKVKLENERIAVPTARFNAIFLLCHIYQHLFQEGIGLRQILDYYFLMLSPEFINMGKSSWDKTFRTFGLHKIAGAIMWILVYQLGMDKKYTLVEPDARRGQFVFNEILSGGNFGRYDERYHFSDNVWGRNLQRLWRDLRLVRYFPCEALSEPFFRLYHAIWRWRHRPKMKKL